MVDTCLDSSVDFTAVKGNSIKFVCSYGGKILPRHPDGKLRYVGGETRVVSLHPSLLTFTDLVLKLGQVYGSSSVYLRCQLPQEDLDALVSITCDEDVANLIEEYDRAAAASSPNSSIKIKAFLYPKSIKKISPPASLYSSVSAAGGGSPSNGSQISTPMGYPMVTGFERSAGTKSRYYPGGPRGHSYLVHNGNHWQ